MSPAITDFFPTNTPFLRLLIKALPVPLLHGALLESIRILLLPLQDQTYFYGDSSLLLWKEITCVITISLVSLEHNIEVL